MPPNGSRYRVARLRVEAGRNTVAVTVSIGVAVPRTHAQDLFELLAAADLALYRAKDSGRDRVCLFTRAAGEPGRGAGGEPEPAGR